MEPIKYFLTLAWLCFKHLQWGRLFKTYKGELDSHKKGQGNHPFSRQVSSDHDAKCCNLYSSRGQSQKKKTHTSETISHSRMKALNRTYNQVSMLQTSSRAKHAIVFLEMSWLFSSNCMSSDDSIHEACLIVANVTDAWYLLPKKITLCLGPGFRFRQKTALRQAK